MAQVAFDHCFNTLGGETYADRYCPKKKLRPRKIPNGNYQVDEDIWGRHPNYGIMYIASVVAVNNYHRTCQMAFVEDEQTFKLPFNHLRHLTPEDIQCNRYMDCGCSWSERTSIGAVNTYDQFGELMQV
jgi:hypothetical protein